MRRTMCAMALLGILGGCGSKDEDGPAPAPTKVPETIIETRPAVTTTRVRPEERNAMLDVMLANANIPLSQAERFARENGITIAPERIAAKREMDRRREGLPKLTGGDEFIAADPNQGAATDPDADTEASTPAANPQAPPSNP